MKLKLSILFFCCLLCNALLQAQTNGTQAIPIIDDLQSADSHKGTIHIASDPAINQLLGSSGNGSSALKTGDTKYVKVSGYRVQAFSGNDPHHSKDEALSKAKRIKDQFPEISTYVTYRSPKWSLRVGDFRTKEEAVVCLQELKRAFPDFGREMYPVKEEEVNIPVNNQ